MIHPTFLGARAAALACRDLRFRDTTVRVATLFPMFDGDGATRALLIVRRDQPTLHLVEWRPGLIEMPWLAGAIGIDETLGFLGNLDASTAESLRDLWHFDPWWLLGHSRFVGNASVPHLKATNCVDEFGIEAAGARFSRDLERLQRLIAADEQTSWVFEPHLLPPRERPSEQRVEQRVADDGQWRLAPIWEAGWV